MVQKIGRLDLVQLQSEIIETKALGENFNRQAAFDCWKVCLAKNDDKYSLHVTGVGVFKYTGMCSICRKFLCFRLHEMGLKFWFVRTDKNTAAFYQHTHR